MTPIVRSDVERFRDAILDRVGFAHDDTKLAELENLLRQRASLARLDVGRYLDRLVALPDQDPEIHALVERVTVGETYFFRYGDHFRAFAEAVIPALAARDERRIHVLSAGCSTGEEPYTIAMVIREAIPDWQRWDVRIHAIDVNADAIARARRGLYVDWSLRATPEVIKLGRFRPQGKSWRLDPAIAAMVTFEERNLVVPDDAFWRDAAWDVVFCRNVLMYFAPDVARGVIERIRRGLTPNGHLFLGHAETLRGLSDGFALCHTHDTFYHRRRDASEKASHPTQAHDFARIPVAPESDAIATDASWIDAIQRASATAATPLQITSSFPTPLPPETAPRPRRADLDRALESMGRERYADALDILHALPEPEREDPDVLLLRAVLLANAHRAEEASRVAAELLEVDPLHAGAHYVLALCREHQGDVAGAIEHDLRAIYLDPTFAIPHLHLGLLAKRSGDLARSRQELGQALMLLQREDAARILLFGGGFRRDALVSLCRNEIARGGGGT